MKTKSILLLSYDEINLILKSFITYRGYLMENNLPVPEEFFNLKSNLDSKCFKYIFKEFKLENKKKLIFPPEVNK